MINFGNVPAGLTLYVPFASYSSAGASVTLTGLAVTDIEIYKDGSVTQRASDAGYALLDTDGIDFDGVTGLHGFSIDLSDNTDAGFYAVGSQYWVVVSTVTIDSQVVTFIAATFRIVPAEASSGVPDVNVASMDANTITATAIATDAITSTKIAADAIGASELAADAVTEIQSGLATAAALATVDANVDAILVDTGTTLPASLSTIGSNVSAILVDTGTTLPASLATIDANVDAILVDTGTTLPGTLATIAAYVDTEVAAIKAVTDLLPDAGALTSLATAAALATVDANVDAILVDTAEIGAAGAGLTAVAATVLAAGDIDGYTLEEAQKLQLAALAGKVSGADTTTVTIRAADDSKARVTATVDANGNRSALTLDAAG